MSCSTLSAWSRTLQGNGNLYTNSLASVYMGLPPAGVALPPGGPLTGGAAPEAGQVDQGGHQ